MRAVSLFLSLLVISRVSTAVTLEAGPVPFKGSWSGVTMSADPANFPVVSIVSDGTGQLTHIGRSPHTTNVFTGETIGDQIFTAANGDTLTASCAGFPLPQADSRVVGSLDCDITGGTGQFEGASGDHIFFLVASPRTDGGIGSATEASIIGKISF